MARIFVSYSRVDRPFVDRLVPLLREVHDDVWFDENLRGGQEWGKEILHRIATCDIFVYLLSNESVSSKYCQDELKEARRLHKKILPVLVRAQTRIPEDLSEIQHVDMSAGIKSENITRLLAAVERLSNVIPQTPPPPLTPEPVPMPSTCGKEELMDTPSRDCTKVFIVDGRNLRARDAMVQFLHALNSNGCSCSHLPSSPHQQKSSSESIGWKRHRFCAFQG